MSILVTLADRLATGAVEVVDLTAPLSAETPVIQLPPQFAQTAPFQLEELSRYDDRGPAWYWNNFRTGEHTGTHFDAPNHWVTGQDREDVASVPAARLIAPAAVLDLTAQVADDPDFLLEVDHVR
jgi:kynurenine formamidase